MTARAVISAVVTIPHITGALSALSSFLTIYLIAKSRKKLTCIYHRLMFGMSVGDIVASIAMALSTIPMPKNLSHELDQSQGQQQQQQQETSYEFIWENAPRHGTIVTCDLQGFLFTMGIVTTYGYNAFLCVYYAFAVGLNLSESFIQQYAEPIFHLVPLLTAIGISVPPIFLKLYNPSSEEPWCSIMVFPEDCAVDLYEGSSETDTAPGTRECIRGSTHDFDNYVNALTYSTVVAFAVMVTSLARVIWRIIVVDRHLRLCKKIMKERIRSSNIDVTKLHYASDRQRDIKAAIYHAVAYLLAFLLTVLFPFLKGLGVESDAIDILKAIFCPLQGFFNFVIFVSHRIYFYKKANPKDSPKQIFRQLFFSPPLAEPMWISRISIVHKDNHMLQIKVYDEEDDYELELPDIKEWDVVDQNYNGNDNDADDNDHRAPYCDDPNREMTFVLDHKRGSKSTTLSDKEFDSDVSRKRYGAMSVKSSLNPDDFRSATDLDNSKDNQSSIANDLSLEIGDLDC